MMQAVRFGCDAYIYTHVRRMRANLPFHILGLADHRDRLDAHQWQNKRLLHQELPQAKATFATTKPDRIRAVARATARRAALARLAQTR